MGKEDNKISCNNGRFFYFSSNISWRSTILSKHEISHNKWSTIKFPAITSGNYKIYCKDILSLCSWITSISRLGKISLTKAHLEVLVTWRVCMTLWKLQFNAFLWQKFDHKIVEKKKWKSLIHAPTWVIIKGNIVHSFLNLFC